MKKRIFAVVLAAALITVGAFLIRPSRVVHAQNAPAGLTMGTTVTANVYGGQTYFYLLLSGGNVTTFNLVNQNAAGSSYPFNPGQVTIVFQQDGTGSRTVGFGSMFAAAALPTVTATANKFSVCVIQYDSASGLWYAVASPHN